MNKHFLTWCIALVLVITGFSISGCNNLFNGKIPYYKLSSHFKNFCYFQAGSRWTYQNDSTGTKYDITINNINSYIGFQPINATGSDFSFDVIEMGLYSNALDMDQENIYATSPAYLSDTTRMNALFRIFYVHGADTTFVLAWAPQYKLRQPQILGGPEGIYTNMEIMPYYLIGKTRYNNVYHSMDKFPKIVNGIATSDSVTMNFYIAEHYGIIKWTKYYKGNTTSYSLVSSDLKQ